MKNILAEIAMWIAIASMIILAFGVRSWIVRPHGEIIDATSTVDEAAAIDTFFKDRSMPLEGYGKEFIAAADDAIDWRLLPAISVVESSGGIHACKGNAFGWSSCTRTFESFAEAIATVGRNLRGDVTGTRPFYGDKTTREILVAYNPPSVDPTYAAKVEHVMALIGPERP